VIRHNDISLLLGMRAGGHGDSKAELTLARGSRRTFASQLHLQHTFASCAGGNGQRRGALFQFGWRTLDVRGERAEGRLHAGGLRMAEDHGGHHHHGGGPRAQ
jgi:hypothetical protein